MKGPYQAVLMHGGQPIVDEKRARNCCRVLGIEFEGGEDASTGVWLVNLPERWAAELEGEGVFEFDCFGYGLYGEMP